jgi:hypothetical protein
MSWDLSNEEVICEKLESQHRIILMFTKKIKKLEDENKKLRKALELCKQEAMRPAYVINICKEALEELDGK